MRNVNPPSASAGVLGCRGQSGLSRRAGRYQVAIGMGGGGAEGDLAEVDNVRDVA